MDNSSFAVDVMTTFKHLPAVLCHFKTKNICKDFLNIQTHFKDGITNITFLILRLIGHLMNITVVKFVQSKCHQIIPFHRW